MDRERRIIAGIAVTKVDVVYFTDSLHTGWSSPARVQIRSVLGKSQERWRCAILSHYLLGTSSKFLAPKETTVFN